MNGGHIACCHTVGSVAAGSLQLGGLSALSGAALGYLVSKTKIKMNTGTAFVVGGLAVGLTFLGMDAYYRACRERAFRNIRRKLSDDGFGPLPVYKRGNAT